MQIFNIAITNKCEIYYAHITKIKCAKNVCMLHSKPYQVVVSFKNHNFQNIIIKGMSFFSNYLLTHMLILLASNQHELSNLKAILNYVCFLLGLLLINLFDIKLDLSPNNP